MKKYLLFILPVCFFVLSGCGSTLKQQWYNFNAYYNTFYNANQYFDRGLEANRSQRVDINPNELIRIHQPPGTAGAEYFEQSIEKCSDILRRHSRSKYVDDALKMIGASYFYRREFFSAIEKFQELYVQTEDPSMTARATIWEGRTYLELESYSEGIRFMETRLDNQPGWTSAELAEVRAVLAQLYAYQGNLMAAGNQLLLALEDLQGDQLRSRAFFHYGQIMERMDNVPQASYAFGEIQNMRPSFDLEYNAKLKSIELLRKSGDLEEAARQLRVMLRNNKFFNNRLEVMYELAIAEKMKGNIEEAEELLNRVIHSRTTVPDRYLVARSYYDLADIYRNNKLDYQVAAAYYDSAATASTSGERLPDWWDADELSRAFGEFAEVKSEIEHLDSLLMLARLDPGDFEQKIAEIEAMQREEVDQQRRQRDRREALPGTIDPQEDLVTTTEADIARHGFLNVNNRALLNFSASQFRSLWGNRPLADDWRRRQAVTGSREIFDDQRIVVEVEEIEPEEEVVESFTVQLDLSEIPFEPHQQEAMEERRFRLFHQLGNVFLMTLNMPDSARTYFEQVAVDGPEGAPRASSMYALMEIFAEDGNEREAMRWAAELVENYPHTSHARLAASRTGLELPVAPEQVPEADREFLQMDESSRASIAVDQRVQRLKSLAASAGDRRHSAGLLYDAAREYIREARKDTVYAVKHNQWQKLERNAEEHPELQALIRNETDSVEVEFNVLSELGFEEETDVLTSGMIASIYPYSGNYWHQARELLREITDNYRGTDTANRAGILLQELEKYRPPAEEPDPLDDM